VRQSSPFTTSPFPLLPCPKTNHIVLPRTFFPVFLRHRFSSACSANPTFYPHFPVFKLRLAFPPHRTVLWFHFSPFFQAFLRLRSPVLIGRLRCLFAYSKVFSVLFHPMFSKSPPNIHFFYTSHCLYISFASVRRRLNNPTLFCSRSQDTPFHN